jgi:hypothetical protein
LKGGDFIKKIVIVLVLLFSLSIPTFAMASNSLNLVASDYDSYGRNLNQTEVDSIVDRAISEGMTTYSIFSYNDIVWYVFTDGSEPYNWLVSGMAYDNALRFYKGSNGDIEESDSIALATNELVDSGYVTNDDSGTTEPVPDETPGTGEDTNESEDNNDMEEGGTTSMFDSLTSSAITTEATTWAGNFDQLLLVVVGVGIGFACVRFVKHLFF